MEKIGYGLYSQGSSGWTSMRNEEFHEGDVWAVFDNETKDSDTGISIGIGIGTGIRKDSGTSLARTRPRSSNTENYGIIVQHSAPIKIRRPADWWSKIYIDNNSRNIDSSCSWWLCDADSDDDGNDDASWESEEEDGGGGDMIPPHEWIANRLCSFSVCEGAGRTLKGRDLSRVRNDVLTKTGFLESQPNYI
ncbi:hypothetical protein ABFS82_13G168100 [Erythranthe guttata]|uniref:Uncharacterized protein n=1 Tax=Erythranthe guttata TaxID=4155 RepID=A0A022QF83_ERYGU|nr:PREDICTED: uncharacterized protein LOC105968546 [Erythranthe guttata]EYU27342.1 hypothetical protein MIMGU_mgv1a026397mg [Erythranthe guttata]|eukprot:XP_012848629.1 PREDICTED: uncharacterized protein LOC105968546 [Erythranthe guttata]